MLSEGVLRQKTVLSGKTMKNRADRITDEERNMIRKYCTVADMYHLKVLLRNTFKNTDYSHELLYNVALGRYAMTTLLLYAELFPSSTMFRRFACFPMLV